MHVMAGKFAQRFNKDVRSSLLTVYESGARNDGSFKQWLSLCGFHVGPLFGALVPNRYEISMPGGGASVQLCRDKEMKGSCGQRWAPVKSCAKGPCTFIDREKKYDGSAKPKSAGRCLSGFGSEGEGEKKLSPTMQKSSARGEHNATHPEAAPHAQQPIALLVERHVQDTSAYDVQQSMTLAVKGKVQEASTGSAPESVVVATVGTSPTSSLSSSAFLTATVKYVCPHCRRGVLKWGLCEFHLSSSKACKAFFNNKFGEEFGAATQYIYRKTKLEKRDAAVGPM